MMNLKHLVLLGSLLLHITVTRGQGFLHTQDQKIVNEKGQEVILRGVGLGGWMLQEGYMLRVRSEGQQQHVIRRRLEELIGKERTDAFYTGWLANHTRKADIDSLAAWGFNSVRLPMHYNLYTLPVDQEPTPGANTWLDQGFAMTDSLLQWCKANKLYLILDLHAAPGGQGNDLNISDRDPAKPSLWQSVHNQQKMIALWRKLAERYADEPYIGAYDIINEPNWGFESPDDKNGCAEQKNEPLKKLMVDITAAIREVDKKHIIIIEGNCWGNNYNGIFPPWDNNTVVSFHKYWNNNETTDIQKFLDIRQRYNVPVWLGESGENSNVWFRDAIHLMESNHIGWAWWPLKKLGANNPLEVKVPAGYEQILDYWAGKGPKPTPEEAYPAITALTENLRIENNIYHRDVVDAMIRQPHSDQVVPFKPHTVGLPIAAVDYDLGRNRYAYFDLDTGNYYISNGGTRSTGNKGHTYRNDGVDIVRQEGSTPEVYYVANIDAGEWLEYTVTVPQSGNYTVRVTTSAEASGGKLYAALNKTMTATAVVPHTGKATDWKTVSVGTLQLAKGANAIRIYAVAGGFNLKTIEIVKDARRKK
ncbi:cellulase family glycosylhydrolase [Dawidia soli]|uniref:Cellulase family glycosylhydrolase n=1 Tax=Dawidia soli TaxID=2782352 RepID=A0AAP2DBX6_9BACT|nr:cellulase family glycosylhydrolase [Dawidia soli]MBT1688045.1 cellulase family glycosylhydrolase [Dawidia soli]